MHLINTVIQCPLKLKASKAVQRNKSWRKWAQEQHCLVETWMDLHGCGCVCCWGRWAVEDEWSATRSGASDLIDWGTGLFTTGQLKLTVQNNGQTIDCRQRTKWQLGFFPVQITTQTHTKQMEGVYGIKKRERERDKEREEHEKGGEKTGRAILSRPCDIYQ